MRVKCGFAANTASLIWSLPSALVAYTLMVLLSKTRLFSTCGLSIAGGMTHNLMQICVASVVVSSGVFVYLPYMMLAGALAGFVTGILCHFIVGALKGRLNIDFKDCEYHRQIDDENDEED